MSLGGKKTSIGIVALALLSSVVVIGTRHRATTGETDARAKNLLSVWRENELTRIELFAQGRRVLLERQDDDSGENVWRLKQPVSEPADQEAVQHLIAELGFAVPARPSDQAAEALGIGDASPAIELTMGGIHYRLRLGNPALPPEGAAYVELVAKGAPGSKTAVIKRDTAALFRMSLDDLRPRNLWSYGETELKTLTIESERGKLELVRGDGASFNLAQGERASRDALSPLFASLSRVAVTRFTSLPGAEGALAAGKRTVVRAVPREGSPLTLEFGGTCPDQADLTVVVRRSPEPLSGCTERGILESLALDPARLIDRQPFSVHPDEVEELDIEREGRRLVLARKGSEFLLRQPSEATVALEAGNARLAAIVGAAGEIRRNADLAALGLEPAAGHVTVTSAGDGKAFQEVVWLGRPAADGQLPLKRQDGTVLMLGRESARAFAIDSTLLRGLKLLEFSGSELRQLSLNEPEPQKLARDAAGSFQLLEPKGFQVDGALASDLALALGA
ncbi:MAG TPA: hypothetical protein VGP93_15775, partial [Polyangiaceae bacterium]|nr:hypothetical protein [Polyangiaceae bacterium]